MKAISVKQPWADLIASGQKTIETRTWPTKYRGPILICSSQSPKGKGMTGYALCIVDIADCRPMNRNFDDEKAACCEWYDGAYAWVLDNLRVIEPFPVKGKLGIYEVDYSE